MALILDGTNKITATELADDAVTTAKIADSAITDALLPAGTVLQVVQVTSTTTESTTSTSYSNLASLNVSITPSSTSNKLLVTFSVGVHGDSDQDGHDVGCQVKVTQTISGTETTVIESNSVGGGRGGQTSIPTTTISKLISPNTTSEVTFKFYYNRTSGNRNLYINNNRLGCATVQEIAG